MKEVWKDIPGCEDTHQVSNLGRVKSVARIQNRFGNRIFFEETILKPFLEWDGYLSVVPGSHGRRCKFRIARIVALVFVPNPDNKPQVNHKDGNKLNNRADNLEWVTIQENIQHAWKMGLCTRPQGSLHGGSKLKEDDVRAIRKRIAKKEKLKDIAKDYNVSAVTITDIKRGKSWSHLK